MTNLDQSIDRLVRQGYRLTYRTENMAQLVKPKQGGCLALAVIGGATVLAALVFGIGGLLLGGLALLAYGVYYLTKQDDSAFLSLTPDGQVSGAGTVPMGDIGAATDPSAMTMGQLWKQRDAEERRRKQEGSV